MRQNKKADHREGDPFFVEHRRFELLTPTLPVLCATNCANAPNSGYIIITSGLCKAFFSVRVLNSAYSYSKVIPAIILDLATLPILVKILELKNRGYSVTEIAPLVGYQSHSAVVKRLKKITDLYDDFVSKKYQNYLETF